MNYRHIGIGFLGGITATITIPFILTKLFRRSKKKRQTIIDLYDISNKIDTICLIGNVGDVILTHEETLSDGETITLNIIKSNMDIYCSVENNKIIINAVADPANNGRNQRFKGNIDAHNIIFWGRGSFTDKRAIKFEK